MGAIEYWTKEEDKRTEYGDDDDFYLLFQSLPSPLIASHLLRLLRLLLPHLYKYLEMLINKSVTIPGFPFRGGRRHVLWPKRNSAASVGSRGEPVPHVSGPGGRPPTAALYYRLVVGCRYERTAGRDRSSEAIYPLEKEREREKRYEIKIRIKYKPWHDERPRPAQRVADNLE